MTRRVPIQVNVANALQWLGTLYRSPADAIKEHVSNAIDEHLKAAERGEALERCAVVFSLEKREVVIEYPYGMSREEFEAALRRVADSAKRMSDVAQIGQLGIGMFSFLQIGRKCTFLSRKDGDATIRVVLREGRDDAEFDAALKRESLRSPGLKVVISELKVDPTKARGPLAPEKLTRLFSEKFGPYLQRGWLSIEVRSGPRRLVAEPPIVDLPRLAQGLNQVTLPGRPPRVVRIELHYDPSGKGVVSVRHRGVVVVEDLGRTDAYGLEESVYASGSVRGWIDADFLRPLPARTGFEETRDWLDLLDLLDKHRSQVEAELADLKAQAEERAASEVQQRAVEIAREILDLDDFRDLELPGGLAKTRATVTGHGTEPTGERTGERSHEAGDRAEPRGPRFDYQEITFPDGGRRHSKYVTGVVLANTLNRDYRAEAAAGQGARLAYAALLIGKEAIAFNDRTGATDEQLEKLLSFHFRLRDRLQGADTRVPGSGGRPRRRNPGA